MIEYYGNNDYRDYLMHYGVKGMKWGKRLKAKAYEVGGRLKESPVGEALENRRVRKIKEKGNHKEQQVRGAYRTLIEKGRRGINADEAAKAFYEGRGYGKMNLKSGRVSRTKKYEEHMINKDRAQSAHLLRKNEVERERNQKEIEDTKKRMYEQAKSMYKSGTADKEYLEAIAPNYNEARRYIEAVDANRMANARGEARTRYEQAAKRKRDRQNGDGFGVYEPISGHSLHGTSETKKKRRR